MIEYNGSGEPEARQDEARVVCESRSCDQHIPVYFVIPRIV